MAHVLTEMAYCYIDIVSAERLGYDKGWQMGWHRGWNKGMKQAAIIIEKLKQNIDLEIISEELGVSYNDIAIFKKILVTPV